VITKPSRSESAPNPEELLCDEPGATERVEIQDERGPCGPAIA
jgi:hypothetical protein